MNINGEEAKSRQKEYKSKYINFLQKTLDGIYVKISDDLQKVIFSSKQENYILERQEFVNEQGEVQVSFN